MVSVFLSETHGRRLHQLYGSLNLGSVVSLTFSHWFQFNSGVTQKLLQPFNKLHKVSLHFSSPPAETGHWVTLSVPVLGGRGLHPPRLLMQN